MKTLLNIIAFAVLLLGAPSSCFALWDVVTVSKEQAKELGMEVRSQATGPNRVSVTLEFKTDGKLKDFSGVYFSIGEGDNLRVSAALREDRSKAGRVVVGFTVERVSLDQANLQVMVPYKDGALGGITYVIRVKDFVGLKKVR